MLTSEKGPVNDTVHSTSYYFLKSMNDIGVDYLFCNFGTDHAPLIEELARFSGDGMRAPQVIICPHENVAMHMAGGFAQVTGRGQAVLVHVDTGTANAALGMHNLSRNRIPAMLIAGSAPFTSFGELTGSRDTYVHFIQQPFDQASLVRPYAKWEYTLPSGVTTSEVLRRAHTIMQTEPQGPVYLMLPREVLTEDWPEAAVRQYSSVQFGAMGSMGGDPLVLDDLAQRLNVAKNPCLITSYGGRDPELTGAIMRLAALTGMRVIDYLTFSNIGRSFPEFGGYQYDELETVDFGLLVDVDVPWLPLTTKLNEDTFWAHVDVDPLKTASPIWTFPANVRVQGRSSRVLSQIADQLQQLSTEGTRRTARARSEHLERDQRTRTARAESLASTPGTPGEINPHYLCRELGKLISDQDIVVNELVTRQNIPNLQISRPVPNTMISNGGGGLGASGGTALGVKLALPDRLVVQLVGDGSFYFNNPSAVYATSQLYGLPIFTIVMDNSGWAAVKGATLRVYPEGSAQALGMFQATHSPVMDFSKIAEAAGAYGVNVSDPAEVPMALVRCLEEVRGGRSALLHAHVVKL